MLFEIAIIAHTAICLICIVLCAKERRMRRMAEEAVRCFFCWMWDNSGLSEEQIFSEVMQAGRRHGLNVEDEPFEVEGEE